MHKFKLIIFDLDGTLVNSYPAIIDSVNYALKKIGVKVPSRSVIRKAVGWGDRDLLQRFVDTKLLNDAVTIYRRHHRNSLKRGSYFMPYAKQLLVYLNRKGYKLAIASNRPRKFLNIILIHLRMNRLFNYVLCKDQIKFGKPHPSILNKIMLRLKVSSDKALYVGDMVLDVRTGKRAGVKTFAVATGSSSGSQLKNESPDFLSKNLSKLLRIL